MLVQLPYEQHVLLPAYLPLLLHLLSAVYAEGTASVLSRATDPALAVHDAANLLESLVANLAPRGQSPPLSQRQLLILLRRVALLAPGLTSVRPLVELLTPIAATLETEWRALALHWVVHARDPDLSLSSLRVFAQLGSGCDARYT